MRTIMPTSDLEAYGPQTFPRVPKDLLERLQDIFGPQEWPDALTSGISSDYLLGQWDILERLQIEYSYQNPED
jgi:hypothetical protein